MHFLFSFLHSLIQLCADEGIAHRSIDIKRERGSQLYSLHFLFNFHFSIYTYIKMNEQLLDREKRRWKNLWMEIKHPFKMIFILLFENLHPQCSSLFSFSLSPYIQLKLFSQLQPQHAFCFFAFYISSHHYKIVLSFTSSSSQRKVPFAFENSVNWLKLKIIFFFRCNNLEKFNMIF